MNLKSNSFNCQQPSLNNSWTRVAQSSDVLCTGWFPTLASIHRRTAWRTPRSSASLLLTTPTTTSSQVKRWWLRGVGHRLSRHLIFLNGLCWCLPRSWTEAPDVETVPETLKDSCVSVSTLPQSQSSEVNIYLCLFSKFHPKAHWWFLLCSRGPNRCSGKCEQTLWNEFRGDSGIFFRGSGGL